MAFLLLYFIASHVKLNALLIGSGLTLSKTPQAMVSDEHICDLSWYNYLFMGLILDIAFWLPFEKKLKKKT